jgi:hypothetical protein
VKTHEEHAMRDAVSLLAQHLGHCLFRVKKSEHSWSYKYGENVELVTINLGGYDVNAVVRLDSKAVEINWFDEVAEINALNNVEDLKRAAATGYAEAQAANARMASFVPLNADPPRYIKRVFLFETDKGIDYGFCREEFGALEPFMAIRVQH